MERRHVLGPMYKLGDAVFLTQNGERSIGEVVGVLRISSNTYYDVSLERMILKAVTSEELGPVSAHDLKRLLSAFMSIGSPTISRRDSLLRQRYAAFLAQALASMDNDANDIKVASDFAVGDLVAVCVGDVSSLGTIQGIFIQNDATAYEVEVMGEVERLTENDIMDLEKVSLDSEFLLGARVRLMVGGHEDDEAYVGTLCSIEGSDANREYSIQFDDGDILGGLGASDLTPLTL